MVTVSNKYQEIKILVDETSTEDCCQQVKNMYESTRGKENVNIDHVGNA